MRVIIFIIQLVNYSFILLIIFRVFCELQSQFQVKISLKKSGVPALEACVYICVLDAQNDPNEMIFVLSEGDSGKWG